MEPISTTEVIEWAKKFLSQSEKEITEAELKEQKKYAVLIQNPSDKTLLSKLLDESSQIHNNKILARRMKLLIDKYGVPEFFSSTDKVMLKLFTTVGYLFYGISVPVFKQRLRSDTSKVIINEKPSLLNEHLSSRKNEQIGQNVNLLGEVVLGDGEANHRYEHYLEALKDPKINYISIKISGIYAQINALNYAQNKIDLCERLTKIYQQCIDYPYTDEKGNAKPKFVNLDMEEYKDTELTIDVFKTVLSLPQFKDFSAGIVIQAYLPDAWQFQSEILEFAKERVANGGAPLKMRLVKGANLQMESIVSSLKEWEVPIYDSKVEVDANYLRILDRALKVENAKALHVGVASHNFFSIGYAHLLGVQNNVEEYLTFEMLEGMANHLPRAMRSLGKQIILYTPVVKDEHFLNAVSYLVRRLDENTGADNFLSYSFNLKFGSEHWNFLQKQFETAFSIKDTISNAPRRTQDRNKKATCTNNYDSFSNEADTDFDLTPNRLWADEIKKNWKKSSSDTPIQIPVQVGENEFTSENKYRYIDRSQEEEVCVYETSLSNLEQVKEIIAIAENDPSNWRKTTLEQRRDVLYKVAETIANKRGDLIGCMSAVTGKTFYEGDVEISEGIDFCRYYPYTMKEFTKLETIKCTPKGIILVIPPWNFPMAIPVGGVAAALAAGNTVILKPATVALPVAWEFAKCFWEAGVPKDALQVVCSDGREPLNFLTAHPSIKHIILTGGTETAFRLLENNPTCPLSAETGGKNSIIVTAKADRDHAIQNIITSAFSNAGQKCSACSLLLLEKEVYNDPDFKTKLVDAVTSLHTGSAWDGGNYVGPMITAENDKLLHAIENLEEGEWWLVKPEFVDKKRFILKPTVKWGVKPGSFTFENELFAPLLSVVCIDSLEQGVEIMNKSEYGLTSGLQSLDESEREYWKNNLEAGNLYINRGITGAIVSRQPFGGMKRSAFGGGIKAGGKNYVSCFMDIKENTEKLASVGENIEFKTIYSVLNETQKKRFSAAIESYKSNWQNEFSVERDISHKLGEENIFRYLPLKKVALRCLEEDDFCDIALVILAAKTANTPLVISVDTSNKNLATIKTLASGNCSVLSQTESDFIKDMNQYDRIRTCSADLSIDMYKHAAKLGKYIATVKPIAEGRFEILHYVKEQSVTFEYHRYGSITEEVNS